MIPSELDSQFETLLDYLQRSRGFDFTTYPRADLMRLIRMRLRTLGVQTFSSYLDYLEVYPDEFTDLFNAILVNGASFFRDAPAWEFLAQEIVPRLLADKEPSSVIRAWSLGCASGEEAYSLAIVLAEALGVDAFRRRVKIYATDADDKLLAQARQASYGAGDLANVPPEVRDKYFEPVDGHHVFRSDLRRSIVFGRHDVIRDALISHLDLLVCRNTLIYFNAEAQAKVLTRLHFALNDGGYLFLGKAETLLTHANLFSPVELKHHIFTKAQSLSARDNLLLLSQTGNPAPNDSLSRQLLLHEIAVEASPAAQLVVDAEGRLALISDHARRLFNLNLKDIGHPFRELEISYRLVDLNPIIDQVYAERRPVALADVDRHPVGGGVLHFGVEVAPLQDRGGNWLGLSISFLDFNQEHQLQAEVTHFKQELAAAYEELQAGNEELETTNEELQATVEELETANEEIQSTSEELETMNEELQSTNEELKTINDELRQCTQEFNMSNAFLRSLLGSLSAGVVVVDPQLKVLIWNSGAEELWGLRADEVAGESLLGLDIGLPVTHLREPLRNTLAGQSDHHTLALDAVNRRGKSIVCYVTCHSLRGPGNQPRGVVLLMGERERLAAIFPSPGAGRRLPGQEGQVENDARSVQPTD